MFALTMGPGMCMAFPDACKTPPFAIPIPYPNIAVSAPAIGAVPTILCDGMPTLNQASQIAVSQGDDAGVMMGLVSEMVMGPTSFILGSLTIMMGGPPVQRLTSVCGQNAMAELPNAVGCCIVPSQTTVLCLG